MYISLLFNFSYVLKKFREKIKNDKKNNSKFKKNLKSMDVMLNSE